MKLSKLYSNEQKKFQTVYFNDKLNVVLAEIKLPKNKNKDTHNLGKSTLGQLIDFTLLKGRRSSFFLFKHEDLFKEFVFYLEVKLAENQYITICRDVSSASKISFKRHVDNNQDFSGLLEAEWDHYNIPFKKAKELLDSFLNLQALKPWSFRNGLNYSLRSQSDYQEIFQLSKFVGKHGGWKPFIAHILGFDAKSLEHLYLKEKEISEKEKTIKILISELPDSNSDMSKIQGILQLKQEKYDDTQKFLNDFNFSQPDQVKTTELIDNVDQEISDLNEERYSLSKNLKKIIESLKKDRILFAPDDAKKIFKEAGILFKGQIKKDFTQLISFNKAITDERNKYLREEKSSLKKELKIINRKLDILNVERSKMLSFIKETDIFDKYKEFSQEVIALQVDILSLKRQKESLLRLQELRAELRLLLEEKNKIQTVIEENVNVQNNEEEETLFTKIRHYFNEIIETVISRQALLSVSANKEGHLEFEASILDDRKNSTSADAGNSYRKLLCMAFDLAVMLAHINDKYPHFIFHDGVFETLDNRKKEKLLEIFRKYSKLGIQTIVTTIDSDLPDRENDEPIFSDEEIIIRLNDKGEAGRLFKMKNW